MSCDGCVGGNVKPYDMDCDGDLDTLVADLDTFANILGCDDGFPFVILRNRYVDPFSPIFDETNATNLQPWSLDVWDMVAIDLDENGKLDLLLFTCHGLRLFLQQ